VFYFMFHNGLTIMNQVLSECSVKLEVFPTTT